LPYFGLFYSKSSVQPLTKPGKSGIRVMKLERARTGRRNHLDCPPKSKNRQR
jgi:hypothetical protein